MARPTKPSPFYSGIALVSWPVMTLAFRYRVSGKEHLPASGGYVLAAGHQSNLDPWALGLALWPKRFLRFMAKSELFWFPIGPLIKAGGGFKVRRGKADTEAMDTAVELAKEGYVVAMFPEGTRRKKGAFKTREKYEASAHSGAARIALEAGVPLVPAGIKGTGGLRRLEPWRVRYGAPIEVTDDLVETTARLMEAIRELEESL